MNIRSTLLFATVFATFFTVVSCTDKQPTATSTSSSSSDQTLSSVATQTSSSQGLASSSSDAQLSSSLQSSSTPSTRTDTTKGLSRDSLFTILKISNWPASNEDKWLSYWDSLLTSTTRDSLNSLFSQYPFLLGPVDSLVIGKNWCGFDSTTFDVQHSTISQPPTYAEWYTASSAGKTIYTSVLSVNGATQWGIQSSSSFQCQYKGISILHGAYSGCMDYYLVSFPDQTQICVYPTRIYPEYYAPSDGQCGFRHCVL